MAQELFLPPEWHAQEMIQLTWPHDATDWVDNLEAVTRTFVEIARQIVKSTRLLIVAPEPDAVLQILNESNISCDSITIVQVLTNDTWARDHGGITVFNEGDAVVYDFRFNGWGLKFPAFYDNLITSQLAEEGHLYGRYKNMQHFVLEGGSIEVDGNGSLMTTTECLLSLNRNSHFSQEQIEEYLIHYFGVSQILWLESGYLEGDDTDSHIDTLARFCINNTISYVQCLDESDVHYSALLEMERELMSFRNAKSESYNLVPLPMADAVYDEDGNRLPATYANFLIMQDRVLVPTYDSLQDSIALSQVAKAFPGFEIIGVDSRELIKQHGSLHCVTMQYPKEL